MADSDLTLPPSLPPVDEKTLRSTGTPGLRLGETKVALEQAGHYEIKGERGRGGQARVYLAVDQFIGRDVALKELLPHAGSVLADTAGRVTELDTQAAAARFLREARLTGQLEHPNIVPVYEIGRRADQTLYYTQRFIRGETLRARLGRCAGLRDRLALLTNFAQICQAMAYAHDRGVVHRDLKPENVMVGEFGETVVVDWGLAKARGQTDEPHRAGEANRPGLLGGSELSTQAGSAMGTPSYMSPEQARGDIDAVDERSDVWSLGVLLFEILSGRLPFPGSGAAEVMKQVMDAPVPQVRAIERDAPPRPRRRRRPRARPRPRTPLSERERARARGGGVSLGRPRPRL